MMEKLSLIYKHITKQVSNTLTVFVFIFIILFGVTFIHPLLEKAGVPEEYHELLVHPVSAEEIAEDFICPCCGEIVADCECGMAIERMDFFETMLNENKNKLDIYSEYAQRFDLDELKDKATIEKVGEYLIETAPAERAVIEVADDYRDLGELKQSDYDAGERLELEFKVKNSGSKELIIDGIDSSCMCTTGQLILDDQLSPEAGMDHSGEPQPEWGFVIKPGEEADLKVFYDPNFHGPFTGEITRTVTLESNDPINSKIDIMFDLTQI